MDSRVWTLRGVRYGVPFAEMINYEDSEHTPDSNSFASTHLIRESDGAAMVLAEQAYKEGDQITESYGALTNGQLLLWFGFIPSQNQMDCLEIQLPDLFNNQVTQVDERLRVLAKNGIRGSSVCVKDSDLLAKLLPVFRALDLSTSEMESTTASQLQKPFSPKRESRVVSRMREFLSGLLQKYSTAVERDERSLKGQIANENRKLAIRLRVGEKRFIKRAISLLDSMKNRVKKAEAIKEDL
eukprot:GILJ01008642.1.p1 GENE.GILJ01008642.1~~GILJ01008642.1.p1  ORF type:complete len:241 (+),score=42.38 GILJ01008642.1:653-1375(+)